MRQEGAVKEYETVLVGADVNVGAFPVPEDVGEQGMRVRG
jgi:hypothetical protein